MKFQRLGFAFAVAVMTVSVGFAQVIVRGNHRQVGGTPANPQALPALQQDLISAIQSMKSALPIYDGDRVRSIRAAHATLLIVDHAISGAKAPVRAAPNVRDNVVSKNAHSRYTEQQISASQTDMQQGLTALQAAWTALGTASGSNPNKQGIAAANHLKRAITEATAAIAIHANQTATGIHP